MRKQLKSIFAILLCLPILFFTACGKTNKGCKELKSLSFYFNESVSCEIVRQTEKRNLNLSILTSSKPNLDYLDSYATLTFTANSAQVYHLYIEYISFKVYTSEASESDLNISISLTNAINENDVGKSNVEDNKYSNIVPCQAKEKNSIQCKVKVDRIIATATGAKLTIDAITQSDMFIDEDSEFKWMIYDLKIYGESRAYNIPEPTE